MSHFLIQQWLEVLWILRFLIPSLLVICVIGQFTASPQIVHYIIVLRIHLHNVVTRVSFLPYTSPLQFRAYFDVDWAGNVIDRRSITTYCIFLGDSLVSWKVKKQDIIYRLSAKPEYRALAYTSAKVVCLRSRLSMSESLFTHKRLSIVTIEEQFRLPQI